MSQARGTVTPKGYRRIRYGGRKGKLRFEHDVVWEKANGSIPKGFHVHHKNEDKLDNKLENLELLDPLTHKRLHSGCWLVDGEWHKKCPRCQEDKPLTKDFWYFKREGWPCHYCRLCMVFIATRNKRKRKANKE